MSDLPSLPILQAGDNAWTYEHMENRTESCAPDRRHLVYVWLDPKGRTAMPFFGPDKAMGSARVFLEEQRARQMRREARAISMTAGRTRHAQRVKREKVRE